MSPTPGTGGPDRSSKVRKWLIRIGNVALVLEIVYFVAGNAFLRSGRLAELINKKPEKTDIAWGSASTRLPGFFKVSGFELEAEWNGLSITGDEPAAHVALDLPPAEIHDVGKGHLAFGDLDLTGNGFETLGWVDVRDKKADGRKRPLSETGPSRIRGHTGRRRGGLPSEVKVV